jgi:hypothetical protein
MTDEPTQIAPEPPAPPAPPSGPSGAGGPTPILIGGLALLVLVLGTGAMFAFNLGPFAQPTPTSSAYPSPTSPIATPSTRPSATVGPTITPAASPQLSPTPNLGPTPTPIPSGDVIAALLSHVPSGIADSCVIATGEGKVLARANCIARDGKIQVTYFLYTDHDSMFATYEGFRQASQIEPNTGSCNNPQSWPAESDFAISGETSGRFLCTEAMGATTIYWTDNRLNIFSEATDTESNYARLVDFWMHDSGPNL